MARSTDRTEVPGLLIAAANKQDRFLLLDDPTIPESDIDVAIHPIFRVSNFINATPQLYENLQQSLRFASMFLQHDSVLEWFVGPLLGLPLLDSETGKSYLSDPLTGKSPGQRHELIRHVRKAFDCLAHSVHFHFINDKEVKFYARTTLHCFQPVHVPTCTPHFNRTTSVKIEVRKQYWDFFQDHFTTSSLCERLRVDFSLGVGLVHELCHAIGVMRRGNLVEPHVRLTHIEKPEFGYAWENFMFGGIINPFDRTATRLSFLMRKVWADDSKVYPAGGKEWSAVPMSYVAQWFRNETWTRIAEHGPTAIAQPTFHLKLRCHERNGYTILTDDEQAISHVKALKKALVQLNKHRQRFSDGLVAVLTAKVEQVSTEMIQHSTVEPPSRTTNRFLQCACRSVITGPSVRPLATMIRSYSNPPGRESPIVDRRQTRSVQPLKRGAEFDAESDASHARKKIKCSPETSR
jgi:hypothetical protein